MSFIGKIFKKTFVYKLYNVFECLYNYLKDKHYVGDTFHSKEFIFVLNKYLKTNMKIDWIGRVYGIVNPNIDSNGNFDISSIIMEIDGENTNNNEYVKNWVYKQMGLIQHLFKLNKMYDYISIDFEHVGPIEMDNYLVVFDIASRQLFTQALKSVLLHLFVLCCIAASVIGGLFWGGILTF